MPSGAWHTVQSAKSGSEKNKSDDNTRYHDHAPPPPPHHCLRQGHGTAPQQCPTKPNRDWAASLQVRARRRRSWVHRLPAPSGAVPSASALATSAESSSFRRTCPAAAVGTPRHSHAVDDTQHVSTWAAATPARRTLFLRMPTNFIMVAPTPSDTSSNTVGWASSVAGSCASRLALSAEPMPAPTRRNLSPDDSVGGCGVGARFGDASTGVDLLSSRLDTRVCRQQQRCRYVTPPQSSCVATPLCAPVQVPIGTP